MTPENEVVIESPAAVRVGNELSRWFGNSDFATRSREPALQEAGRHIDWARVLPFLLMHAACLAVIWVGFSWVALAVTLTLYVVRMFAITGFYHRYFSHRTFKTSRVGQFIFGMLGASAVQRGPIWWAAHHRHHHVYSDKPEDVHSPVQHGFFWSHMGWFMSHKHFAADLSRVKDLLKYPELRFLDRFDVVVPTALGVGVFLLGVLLKHVAPGCTPADGRCWYGASSSPPCWFTTALTPLIRSRTCSVASATRPAMPAATIPGSRSLPWVRAGITITIIIPLRCARDFTGGNSTSPSTC